MLYSLEQNIYEFYNFTCNAQKYFNVGKKLN